MLIWEGKTPHYRGDKPDPMTFVQWAALVIVALAVTVIVVGGIHLAEVLSR